MPKLKNLKPLKHFRDRFLQLKDTPHAIALGVAIGVFFGFIPLFGIKTLLAIGVTWLCRGNKVAAAIAVSLHDVLLPVMPVLLRWEYDVGYWLLSNPHELPPHMHLHHLEASAFFHWETFLTIGRPLLVGSVILSLPLSALVYGVTLTIMFRRARAAGTKRSM